jgi:hypothetical protein
MLNKQFPKTWNLFVFLCLAFSWLSSASYAFPVTPMGKKLSDYLDSLQVTKRWLPNRYVDWMTGASLGQYRQGYGTHCSTFVAAAASKLGVYILSPRDQVGLLANAQYHWLQNQGASYGWATVHSQEMAQQIANQGCLVVASYANPNRHRPGHIVIVRPSTKSQDEILSRGPQIIQAGSHNYNSTTLSKAFRHPQSAFLKHKLLYYAHATPFCRLLVQKSDRGHSKVKKL